MRSSTLRTFMLLAGIILATATASAADAAPTPGTPPAGAAPAAPPSSPAAPQPQGGPGTGANWKIHRHATGLSLRYPPDWTLTPLETALQLIPPGVTTGPAGPNEAYFVLGEGAQGIVSPEDPRVLHYFDQQLAQFAPFLRRIRQPERLPAGPASGILLSWEGTGPTGMAVRAQVFATILKGYAVAILALGDRGRMAERDATVRAIFASLAAGAGEKDARLVGSWRFWSYSGSPDGRYGRTTDRRFILQPDGSCFWSSSSESSGVFKGTDSLGNTVWTGSVAGQSADGGSRGQWSAANGELYVLWADGTSSEWNYQVSGAPGGRRLFLKGNQPKPDEWVEGN